MSVVESAQLRAHAVDDRRVWRGPQVCSLSGVTYRQLDYWARTGALMPSVAEAKGSGTARLYSTTDVAVAVVLTRLRQLGCELSALRRFTSTLQSTPLSLWPTYAIVSCDGLLVELTDALTAASGDLDVCWLVNLRRVIDGLDGRIEQLG